MTLEGIETAEPTLPWRSQTWPVFRDETPGEISFLVDGLWPRGALGFIAARPKAGKTWLAIAVAVAVVTGRPLFGEYTIGEPQDVLYVALEGARAGLRARIGCVARGLDIDPDNDRLDRLHILYRPTPFNLADPELAPLLITEAGAVDAALVIVDVLRQAARGVKEASAEDFAVVRDALEPLLANDRSVALLHHFGKLNDTQKERTPGERMVGSGVMEAALDVAFYITNSDNRARRLRVEFEARDFATPEPIGISITGSGSGEHGGFTYNDRAELVLDPTAANERDLAAETEHLLADGKWRVLSEIASKTSGIGGNKDEIRRALEDSAERFGSVSGPRVDRHATAKPWGTIAMLKRLEETEKLAQTLEPREPPQDGADTEPPAEQVAPLRGEPPSHLLLDQKEARPEPEPAEPASPHDEHEIERLARIARAMRDAA